MQYRTTASVYTTHEHCLASRAPAFTPDFSWAPCFSFFICLCCIVFFVFCLSLSCVLCAQWCQCLTIVHSWLPIRFYFQRLFSTIIPFFISLIECKRSQLIIFPYILNSYYYLAILFRPFDLLILQNF
jgi:hypothetical protein